LESVFTATMVALANNFTNKSYVTGIQTFVQALSDPERHMPTMHQRYAASFIPSALGQTVGAFDDNMRDVNGVLEGMLAKLPYFGEGIPPIRNILGEPVVRRRSLGHDSIGSVMSLILPLAYREVSDDQIAGELASIGHGFTPPRSVIGNYDLRDFKSTKGQDAYDRWQELQGKVTVGGRSLRKTLGRLINSRTYQRMATEGDIGAPSPRIGEIRKVIGQYRRKAWRQLIREYPDVKAADVNLKRVRREMKRANRSVAQMVGGN